jgi:hypothetical protein
MSVQFHYRCVEDKPTLLPFDSSSGVLPEIAMPAIPNKAAITCLEARPMRDMK